MKLLPCLSFLLTALAPSSPVAALPHAPTTSHPWPPRQHWRGWQNVKYLFTFGDSYSTTGFNASTGPQPNPANPLGNPPYPGYTASNGPNYVDFLTTTYNRSYIQTYNLAYGGATVDKNLVAQYLPTVIDLKGQVQDEFVPIYGSKPDFAPWSMDDSLFLIFIGINDVGNSYAQQNASLNGYIFEVYKDLVEQLYQTGARNFLLMNVPPVDLSPGTTVQGPSAVALEAADIQDFNIRINVLAWYFRHVYPDVVVYLFDTNYIFEQVLKNPDSYPQTAVYRNTTDYCPEYANGTPSWYTFYPECGIPVDEYFWLNSLHPTFPMHNATAYQISRLLTWETSRSSWSKFSWP